MAAKKKAAAKRAAKAGTAKKAAKKRPGASTRPARKTGATRAARKKPAKLGAAARKTVPKKALRKQGAKFAAARRASTTKKSARPAAKLTPAAKKTAAKIAKEARTPETLELRVVLPASPERVLAAWLDSAEHSAFTGSDATIDARVGGKHSAWNGYIEGEILEIEDGSRVVMSWRTTEFDAAQPDSIVVVEAHPHASGTELRLLHTELPHGGAEKYGQGWREFYFAPMASYFRK